MAKVKHKISHLFLLLSWMLGKVLPVYKNIPEVQNAVGLVVCVNFLKYKLIS